MSDVFETIYRENRWNGVESLSGPGSGPAATRNIAAAIVDLVQELGIRSVLDVACGDGYWMPDLPGYVGIDVSPTAIAKARLRHPDRHYVESDIRDVLTGAFDLVIVRDVIQHLPLREAMSLLFAVRATGSKWLLASTYSGTANVDIEAGDTYSPDLREWPFKLGHPHQMIFDGYTYHDPDAIRDPSKYLGLWALR